MCFHNPWFYLLVLVVNCEKWKHLVKTPGENTPVYNTTFSLPSRIRHTCICIRAPALFTRAGFTSVAGQQQDLLLLVPVGTEDVAHFCHTLLVVCSRATRNMTIHATWSNLAVPHHSHLNPVQHHWQTWTPNSCWIVHFSWSTSLCNTLSIVCNTDGSRNSPTAVWQNI